MDHYVHFLSRWSARKTSDPVFMEYTSSGSGDRSIDNIDRYSNVPYHSCSSREETYLCVDCYLERF